MKGFRFISLAIILVLVACSPEQPEPPARSASPAAQAAALEDNPITAAPLPTTAPRASPTPLPILEPATDSVATADPATFTPQPSPTIEPVPLPVVSGQTAEGAFFLGAPDAPVTLIDYSDFL